MSLQALVWHRICSHYPLAPGSQWRQRGNLHRSDALPDPRHNPTRTAKAWQYKLSGDPGGSEKFPVRAGPKLSVPAGTAGLRQSKLGEPAQADANRLVAMVIG